MSFEYDECLDPANESPACAVGDRLTISPTTTPSRTYLSDAIAASPSYLWSKLRAEHSIIDKSHSIVESVPPGLVDQCLVA